MSKRNNECFDGMDIDECNKIARPRSDRFNSSPKNTAQEIESKVDMEKERQQVCERGDDVAENSDTGNRQISRPPYFRRRAAAVVADAEADGAVAAVPTVSARFRAEETFAGSSTQLRRTAFSPKLVPIAEAADRRRKPESYDSGNESDDEN